MIQSEIKLLTFMLLVVAFSFTLKLVNVNKVEFKAHNITHEIAYFAK